MQAMKNHEAAPMMSRVTGFAGSLLKFPSTAEPQLVKSTETKGAAEKERRLRGRQVCYGFAEGIVLHPKSLFRGTVRDLSETGYFVETRARLHALRGSNSVSASAAATIAPRRA